MALRCRYYEKKFPDMDDVVMVNVLSIQDMGAYVSLLEYDDIEGMILLSELSRRRIRSINKLIRVGRTECVVVLRVDPDKGYIDLSKRRVSPEEAKKCEEKYNKAKAVNSILRHVAETEHVNLEDLYQRSAWPLERKYPSAYDAFKLAIAENSTVLDELPLQPKEREALLVNIRRRLTPQPVRIRADIEVRCYTYEGIDAVKEALRAGLAKSTEELPIKIKLIAPPLYVVTTTSLDKDAGIESLKQAIDAVEAVIKAKDGHFNVKMAPKVVSETDDKELAAIMEKFERENQETDGDDSGDEEVGMGSAALA
eukprot:m.53952 g.53952  ORF g.53952 m.53952 type:complete len:311 (+) comp13209_c0_seq1:209-1141(+)